MKILHIVNPVNVQPSSDLYMAQPVTFQSMQRAKAELETDVDLRIVACGYDEDREITPEFFDDFVELKRSVLDIAQFRKDRKLPLLADILQCADRDADYVIYSNVDIALMPWFYDRVVARIKGGLEAFVINRRTISSEYDKPEELAMMYAQAGEPHPGLDCFVMKRELMDRFVLADTCIGATFIGKVLEANLLTFTDKYAIFKHDHMTFHIGDDRSWKKPELDDYTLFNKTQLWTVMNQLLPIAEKDMRMDAIARIKEHLYRHFDWNEDGHNPYLVLPTNKKTPFRERLKRSLGALVGNS